MYGALSPQAVGESTHSQGKLSGPSVNLYAGSLPHLSALKATVTARYIRGTRYRVISL